MDDTNSHTSSTEALWLHVQYQQRLCLTSCVQVATVFVDTITTAIEILVWRTPHLKGLIISTTYKSSRRRHQHHWNTALRGLIMRNIVAR